MKLFFQILVGIGIFLLAWAGLAYVQTAYFVSHAQQTSGTIVALALSTDPDNNANFYCPEVSYVTQSGQTVHFSANVCSTESTYKVGDPIEVYYDAQNPQTAQIKSFGAQYLVAASLVISGLPIVLTGLFGIFLQKRSVGRN